MKRSPSLALVASGPTRHNLLARLPRLAQHLGPVKGPTLRISSRLANSLKGGWPARDWAELARADILFICVPPGRTFTRTVAEMAQFPALWRGKIVTAVDVPNGRQALAPLLCEGAIPALLLSLDTAPPAFILEADRRTSGRLRPVIRDAGGVAIDGTEEAYSAVSNLTAQDLPQIFETAMAALRQSGLDVAQAKRLVEVHFYHALRLYLRGKTPAQRTWRPIGIPAD